MMDVKERLGNARKTILLLKDEALEKVIKDLEVRYHNDGDT